MTHKEKLAKVKASTPGISDKEAKEQVKIVDWLTKWDHVLRQAHINYQIETKDNQEYLEFCLGLYHNDKNFVKDYSKMLSRSN